jgi:hydrogenase maturation factor
MYMCANPTGLFFGPRIWLLSGSACPLKGIPRRRIRSSLNLIRDGILFKTFGLK